MIARSGVQPEHSGVERATVRVLNNRSRLLNGYGSIANGTYLPAGGMLGLDLPLQLDTS